MAVLGDDPRLLPHLHLSAQHGDDVILKRMKRRHLARDILRFCDEALCHKSDGVWPDVIRATTESDLAHQASLDMIEAAGITHLHVFPYSPRSGTPAADMPQLPPEIIKARARVLRQLGEKRLDEFLDSAVGSTDQLLVEKDNRGHGRNFTKIQLDGPLYPSGCLVSVNIVGRNGDSLVGTVRASGVQGI